LLQLTIDAAQKYAPGAGLSALREVNCISRTSILLGSQYLAELFRMFPISQKLWRPLTTEVGQCGSLD
jgi:hypothetical protein